MATKRALRILQESQRILGGNPNHDDKGKFSGGGSFGGGPTKGKDGGESASGHTEGKLSISEYGKSTTDKSGREIFHTTKGASPATATVIDYLNKIPTKDVIKMQSDDDLSGKYHEGLVNALKKAGHDPDKVMEGVDITELLPDISDVKGGIPDDVIVMPGRELPKGRK